MVTRGCAALRGVQVPLQFPLPTCTIVTGGSALENVAATEPSELVIASPQLSATRTPRVTGWPTVTLAVASVNVVGCTSRVVHPPEASRPAPPLVGPGATTFSTLTLRIDPSENAKVTAAR